MQIREQGPSVQCIRSVYDSTLKRNRQKTVAKFSRYTTTMPATGLDELTEPERQELSKWLDAKREQSERATRTYSARSAAHSLSDATAALIAGEVTLSDEKAAELWKAIGAMAKALRKAGHPKPKPTMKQKSAAPVTPAESAEPAMRVKAAQPKPVATKPSPKAPVGRLATSVAVPTVSATGNKPAKTVRAPKGKGGDTREGNGK